MRLAIDVMGGDHAPDAILAGCIEALPSLGSDDHLILVGDEARRVSCDEHNARGRKHGEHD